MVRKLLRLIVRAVLSLLVLLILLGLGAAGYLFFTRPHTPQFKDASGRTIPESIATLEEVTLGGCRQWILIRGRDINNPFLLFLHGGPGMPAMYLAHAFQRELEKDFVVVHWDRRGAGKSYSKSIPVESLTDAQLAADAAELIAYLKNRFGVPKVYLVGHSWGTLLGLLLAKKSPQDFYAYIGIGQLAFSREIPAIQDRFIRQEAAKAKNSKALKDLLLKGASVHEKWIFRYGGELYHAKSFWPLLWTGVRAPEYTLSDILNITKGVSLYGNHFRATEFPGDPADEVFSLEVPVYFFTGRHDYVDPFELSERYFEKLRAPLKRMVWFENSAHFPFFEEALGFTEEMRKVLKETYGDR
jgi:pimeloyl-ACP methyl ester carboxylesterase